MLSRVLLAECLRVLPAEKHVHIVQRIQRRVGCCCSCQGGIWRCELLCEMIMCPSRCACVVEQTHLATVFSTIPWCLFLEPQWPTACNGQICQVSCQNCYKCGHMGSETYLQDYVPCSLHFHTSPPAAQRPSQEVALVHDLNAHNLDAAVGKLEANKLAAENFFSLPCKGLIRATKPFRCRCSWRSANPPRWTPHYGSRSCTGCGEAMVLPL
jgi:hypothetical protein